MCGKTVNLTTILRTKLKISFHTIDFISAASYNFSSAPVSRYRACIPALVYTACISAQTIQSCQLALQIFHNHQFFSKVGRYQHLKVVTCSGTHQAWSRYPGLEDNLPRKQATSKKVPSSLPGEKSCHKKRHKNAHKLSQKAPFRKRFE